MGVEPDQCTATWGTDRRITNEPVDLILHVPSHIAPRLPKRGGPLDRKTLGQKPRETREETRGQERVKKLVFEVGLTGRVAQTLS
jgi:hypothetical protein